MFHDKREKCLENSVSRADPNKRLNIPVTVRGVRAVLYFEIENPITWRYLQVVSKSYESLQYL